MNVERVQAIEFLKKWLGLLFLNCYTLVTCDEIMKVIDDYKKKTLGLCYVANHSPVCMLRTLIIMLETRKDDLIRFSSSKFLGPFQERAHLVFNTTIPDPLDHTATLMFFDHYLNNTMALRHPCEHLEMIDWCLLVVQFEEASVDRTMEAMSVLRSVREAMDHTIINDDVCIDNDDEDDEESVVNYGEDTKPCSCVEYEKSGDCACADDDVY